MLINVLLISGGIHALAIFILGGITIYKYIIPDEAQFEEAPEIAEERPPPDVKVEIKPQAPPPQATQSLRMKQVGNIAVSVLMSTYLAWSSLLLLAQASVVLGVVAYSAEPVVV